MEVLLICCARGGEGARRDGEARLSVCGRLEARAERASHELARTGRRHGYVVCIGLEYCSAGRRPIPQRRDDGYGVAWWENQLPRLTNDVSIGDGALARNGVYRWTWTVQCIACTGQASRNIQSRGGTDAQIIRLDFIADGRRDRGPKLIPGSNSDTSSLPDFHLHSSPRTIVPHYTQRPWRKKRRQSTSRSFHPRLISRVV